MKFWGVAATSLLLAGCASTIKLSQESTAVKVAEALPAPDAPRQDSLETFHIGATDLVKISVLEAPDLSTEGQIDSGGFIVMPLVGGVRLAGLTPLEAATAIEDKLRGRYVNNPHVTVALKEVKSSIVTIDGAVKKPGLYPVVGEMTLQGAIARAEGANDFANIRRVIVFRTVGGQKMAAMFDLRDIRSGKIDDPRIYGNDIVVIGESAVNRLLRDSQTALPILNRFLPVL